MSEERAISKSDRPATVESLLAELRQLGVTDSMTVMVHSSLSRLGFVAGGAQAVVQALLGAVGTTGTLMMPAHSGQLSDPALWQHPPVPEEWWAAIQEGSPAYDPALTPTRSMGAVVECFRTVPGVMRSAHPTLSACAVGTNAAYLTTGHELDEALGESSPQARLYDVDGHILLIGVDHANNTSLHLSEHRAAPRNAHRIANAAPVMVQGERRWVTFRDIDDDTEDFPAIGDAFDATGLQTTGPLGAATAHLMRARDIVDFATDWMRTNRTWSTN